MGEPLFDGITAGIVSFGVAAVLVLRMAVAEVSNARRAFRLDVAGHVLLGLSVSLLLSRWISGVTSLPSDVRPSTWLSGTLAIACGLGIVAAVKAVVGFSAARRTRDFAIAAVCGAVALAAALAWEWVLLLLAFLAVGGGLAMWRLTRTRDVNVEDRPREPVLVLIVSAAMLLLLLGTWQHVIENETQRQTRSPRYSAWPRATALRDAWERTGWIAKPGDDESIQRVANVASHEQGVALGLGALLLVVIASASCRASPEKAVLAPTNSEASDAS